MKLRKISYFLALCEERSFTRAAKRCGIAQPSLTRAIQLLEQEVGGRLFERGGSSVQLTELGTRLFPDFLAISRSAENITRTAANFVASDHAPSAHDSAHEYPNLLVTALIATSVLAIGTMFQPQPTAHEPDAAIARMDPHALQSTIDTQSLPVSKLRTL
ncbi:MAG TPA: LysR family transcriptional regulator [Pseudolabrys sp.]|nr:LysR family transcriptional regulator [Pseudolabrys sp.]